MRRLLLTAGILCLLLPAAYAEEPPDELFFRMEVGVEPGHFVVGKMLRTGPDWNGAALDLDGDGKFEKEFTFKPTSRGAGRTYTPRNLTFDHDGASWMLDLTYTRFPVGAAGGKASIRWSVTKGEFYAWFINGYAAFSPSVAAGNGSEAKALRMGPPFHFETGSRTRGMQSLVRVGLKDSNGCTMRLARVGGKQRQIQVRLLDGKKEVLAKPATYG